MNTRELPTDRLSTADEEGRRIYIYAADVAGKFRTLRNRLNILLIALFLGLPWIRINGHQAFLLDIARRRFTFFGVTYWAHDTPLILFILGGAVVTLALITAVWGRIWCGWGCPQTVFVDGVFRKVERWIEGNALTRQRRDAGPWTLEKVFRKSLKWLSYLIIAWVLSHGFLAYFVGTDTLLEMIRRSPLESPTSFVFMLVVTGGVIFDFGWFQEQFCTIVCPYGRFQSVLLDDYSMVVAYDAGRGEPRKGLVPAGQQQGDCVNCYRCVQVCPTGIDIRRGLQLECIACTACIDACAEVMRRLRKPLGLIRYSSTTAIQGAPPEAAAKARNTNRARAAIYGVVLSLFAGILAYHLAIRVTMDAVLVRAVGEPYQVIERERMQPEIVNHFKVDFANETIHDLKLDFQLPEALARQGIQIVLANHARIVPAGQAERADLFVRFPKDLLKAGRGAIQLEFRAESDSGEKTPVHYHAKKEVDLVGPF